MNLMSSRCFAQTASVAFSLAISLSLLSFGRLNGPVAHAKRADPTASIGGCPLFPANNIWNRDISALPVASNSGAAAQPSTASPTPTGQPSPTTSPTAGGSSPTPGSSQPTAASGGAPKSGQSGSSGLSIRVLFLLVLGSLGILLAAILAIRRRLQEIKRLAAEAQPKQDSQPPT